MHAIAGTLRGAAVTRDRALPAELEQQLPELTTLAFRVAFSVLRQQQDAEDVAQDVVILACRKYPSLRTRDRLRPWIVRVAWRRALDHRRGSRRREQREQVVSVSAPAAVAHQSPLQSDLFTAIDGLPVKLRMTLLLCALEGYDTREAAALLRVPEGTVRSRLHLARKRLLEILK
jgi:RNA polymerase sigma-70 factor (ECF subfamily)